MMLKLRDLTRSVIGLALFLALLCPAIAAGQSTNVTIDDQPTIEQKIGRINDLRRARRHGDAANLLQELIDEGRFKLVAVEPGRYVDAERWAHRELGRDGELLEAYRDRYNASGEHALDLATNDGSIAALREVSRQFAMTPAGLQASIALAGRLLALGDADSATSVLAALARHPDRLNTGERVTYLTGICDAMRGKVQAADRAVQRLRRLDHEDLALDLEQFIASLDLDLARDVQGLADAGEQPDGLIVPLWETRIGPPRLTPGIVTEDQRILPAVTSSMVLVNNAQRVIALDRASGQQVWAYPERENLPSINEATWSDTRGLAMLGEHAFAIIGPCRGIGGRGIQAITRNTLVCLDTQNGAPIWTRIAGNLHPHEPTTNQMPGALQALEDTHFVGTPIAAEGQVLVMLRRTNVLQYSHTTWLMSLDAATGEVQWFRHIAVDRVPNGSRTAERSTPQLTLAGDTIYLTDNLAVAAAIDLHSGAYRWLRVLDTTVGPQRTLSLASQNVFTPPVLTDAGLMVCLPLDDSRLVLLDPSDGRTIQSFSEDDNALRNAQYILNAGDGVIVVTLSSVAFWDATTSQTRWTFNMALRDRMNGRGGVTRQFALIPTLNGVSVLRLSDGQRLSQASMIPGSILALDAEVLVIADNSVKSYMSWPRAYDRLIAMVTANPNDPDPALSLASLALIRGQDNAIVQKGLNYAVVSLDRLETADSDHLGEARQRVFEAVRQMTQSDSGADDDLRRYLFDTLGLATHTPSQHVIFHLESGRFLGETGEAAHAVEHFQAVMVDPVLSQQTYAYRQGTISRAGAVATQELLRLIETHGIGIYAKYDAHAQLQIDQLLAQGDASTQSLKQIATHYPLARAASQALLIAARHEEEAGRLIAALNDYQWALYRSLIAEQKQDASGALLSFYERRGRPGDGMAMLRWLESEFPSVWPSRNNQPTAPDSWAQIFNDLEDKHALPPLAQSFDAPIIVPGRLLESIWGDRPGALSGRLYVHRHEAGQIDRLDPDNPRIKLWTAQVPGRLIRALNDDQGQLLVWSVDTHELIALNSETGEAMWEAPTDLSALGYRPPQVMGPDVSEDLLPLMRVGPTIVCMVGRNGHVMGIDRHTGKIAWQAEAGMSKVTAIDADAWTLAIAGHNGPTGLNDHGKILLLNLFTGTPRLEQVNLHVAFAPGFVGLSGKTVVVVGAANAQANAFDTTTGQLNWAQTFENARRIGQCAITQNLLAIETPASGMVHYLDLNRQGRTVSRLSIGAQARLAGARFTPLSDGMLTALATGIILHNDDGTMRWRDAVTAPYKQVYRTCPGQQRVAMLAALDPADDPGILRIQGQTASYGLFILDRTGGTLLEHYTIGPIQGPIDPRRAILTGHGIAIWMGPNTLVLPGQPETPTQ